MRLGSSSVPWSRRCALALLGCSSLSVLTPLPVSPTKTTAAGHPAGGSGSFPSSPRSLQPAVSTVADSAIPSLLTHGPLQHVVQTHLSTPGFTELTKMPEAFQRLGVVGSCSIPQHLDVKTHGTAGQEIAWMMSSQAEILSL